MVICGAELLLFLAVFFSLCVSLSSLCTPAVLIVIPLLPSSPKLGVHHKRDCFQQKKREGAK